MILCANVNESATYDFKQAYHWVFIQHPQQPPWDDIMDKAISLMMRLIHTNPALGIAGLYSVMSLIWILFSDQLSLLISHNPETLTQIQMLKGVVFIVLTTLVLYLVLKNIFDRFTASQQHLKQSNERYLSLVECTSDWIWEVDKDGIYTYVSPKIKDLLGYEPEEVLGKTPGDLMPAQEAERVSKILRKTIAAGNSIITMENINLHKKGHQVILETSAVPLFNDTGKLLGYRGIDRDITERRQVENRANELERKFITLLANLQGMAYRCQNNHDWTMEFISDNCQQLTGYQVADLLSSQSIAYNDLIHPDDKEMVWETTQKRIAMDLPFQLVYRIKTVSGETKWVWEQGISIKDCTGKLIALEGFITDITEHKLAEQENEKLQAQLRHVQKMEAIGTLAGGIAHDFNNLLSPIMGYTELAIEALADNPVVSNDLKQVLKASERAKELVKQILSFSHHSDHERKPVQLNLIVNEAMRLLRASIPTTIEVRQNINSNCGYVLADPTQMHQIVINICTNAYHAMREKEGILHVKLEQVSIDVEQANLVSINPGSYIKLEISDSGHGMDEQTLERIFEPYYTTKSEDEGTGLGLSVVHGIVRSHDGGITVTSTPAQGTKFEIFFPRVSTTSTELGVDLVEPIPSGNEHILLIDDEVAIVQMETALLENLGYKVTAVTSSDEALATFEKHPDIFDLTISDMTMPHITGADLARKFLSIRPDMPFILCTGFSEIINEEKAREIGIQAYIKKPVLRKEMAIVVRKALDNSMNYHRIH
ncbi:MAG: PAS domain S-box protein [Gammaproteobacteria bacterium]